MKKVLLVSNHGGGFYNFKKELIDNLISAGTEVHFAVPYDGKVPMMVEKGAIYHEIKIDRRGMNPIKDFSLMLQLFDLNNRINPDVLVLHTIKPNIYGSIAARVSKIPYINNITGLGSALQLNNYMARILRMLYRCSLSKSSAIFFENDANLNYFSKYSIGNLQSYILVPGAGVNTDHYFPREKKLTDSKSLTLLFIGRIMREKGINEYFTAAQYFHKKYQNIKFQVVGPCDEPEYENMLHDQSEAGVIEYLGISNDTRVEMSSADCIVLPSYHEGMSNVLLEGASMGLPLITSDISGCKEAVEDGKNGFLCKSKSAESLITAIEKFIQLSDERRREMGHYGRIKMIQEFERTIVVRKYIEVIQNILS